ncbi:MAG: hypothetical protein U0L98_03485 [Clostridia bacterium]|nr:hypothetical protein [Clostridia bacterium]
MKRYKKFAYMFLIIVIVVLSFTVYAIVNKDTDKIEKEKIISEFKYLESELLDIFNELNNIQMSNYNVSVNNITSQTKKEEDSKSDGGQNQQDGQQSGTGSSNFQNDNSSINNSDNSEKKQQKEYNLKRNAILTNNEEINWNDIKNKIEIVYSSIPIITLDLYKYNINQEDILKFNKEFDNLTVTLKQNNKQDSLILLSKLYDYMSKFSQSIYDDDLRKILIETKSNILKAYSKLDTDNWNDISNDIKQASNSYSKLLTNPNIDQSKQYDISKMYVMINELQNAVQVKDKQIFLIKYKNIIEEMNILS